MRRWAGPFKIRKSREKKLRKRMTRRGNAQVGKYSYVSSKSYAKRLNIEQRETWTTIWRSGNASDSLGLSLSSWRKCFLLFAVLGVLRMRRNVDMGRFFLRTITRPRDREHPTRGWLVPALESGGFGNWRRNYRQCQVKSSGLQFPWKVGTRRQD